MKKEYLIYKLSEEMKEATRIDTELFSKFDVKRGLRNEDGTGVLVGLTRIGNVVGYERVPGGGLKPIPGSPGSDPPRHGCRRGSAPGRPHHRTDNPDPP